MVETEDEKDNLDLEQFANEVFRKNSDNIRSTFDHVLSSTYDLSPHHFYVADRASENVKGFWKHYLCCAGHQFDNSYK